MSQIRKISSLTIGLAIFSMFFGSGNLVFPLYLGQLAKSDWLTVACSFATTGVIGPFLGVLTMVLYKGCTKSFFSTLPRKIALLFIFILTAVWIPLGAGPRCINVSFDTITFVLPGVNHWMYILAYTAIIWMVIQKPTKMLQILGYALTPILLISLISLWIMGVWNAPGVIETGTVSTPKLIYEGTIFGYNTLDFIAGFFYSASLINTLRGSGLSDKVVLKKVFLAGSIGMVFLAVIYFSFVYLAARYSHELGALNISQFIGFLSIHLLGPKWSVIPVMAVVLACLSTSIAMTYTYAQFLHEEIFSSFKKGGLYSKMFSAGSTLIVSLLGMKALLALISPVLLGSSYLLLLLTLYNLIRRRYRFAKPLPLPKGLKEEDSLS